MRSPPARAQIEQRMSALGYFGDRTPPNLDDYKWFDPCLPNNKSHLLANYRLRMDSYDGNLILIHKDARPAREETPVNLHGHYNVLLMDRESGLHGKIDVTDNNNLMVFMGEQGYLAIDVRMYGGDTLVWGRGAVSWGMRIWVQGGTTCTIGDGCLFSENTTIRTTDHHTIFDLDTLQSINAPKDVTIGKYVWVGQDCSIGKGVVIGDGSIVGARSFVNSHIGRAELWAGSPARKLRDRVSWVVSHPDVDAAQRDRVLAALGEKPAS